MMTAANTARIARERHVVAALIAHLGTAGWSPYINNDGEEYVYCPTPARALASVFSVDESRLHFAPAELVATVEETTFFSTFIREEMRAQRRYARKACNAACHAVLLICGNDEDIISDWWSAKGDKDGFSAAMNAFIDTRRARTR